MQDNTSPEGRLLALIKKSKKQDPAPEHVEKGVSPQDTDKVEAVDTVKKKVRFQDMVKLIDPALLKHKLADPQFLKLLNKYMIGILTALVVYFVVVLIFVRPKPVTLTLSSEALRENAAGTRQDELLQNMKDYSFYSQQISGKNIFGPPPEESHGADTGRTTDEAVANLNLAGIIAGDPSQAIIEDKKLQKTYYLTKGQAFDGFTVEDISDDKVTLRYEGRRIMLIL